MFRHVVMFRWAADASADARQGAVDALRAFGDDIQDLGRLTVGADARVADGNFDAAVVVDFPDVDTYQRYASDPRHVTVVSTYVKPILAERVAVQYQLD
ncbi:MAG TPA: Dabb family protein [Micromonosporaceae bacterium]|jgi:hypothetical protein